MGSKPICAKLLTLVVFSISELVVVLQKKAAGSRNVIDCPQLKILDRLGDMNNGQLQLSAHFTNNVHLISPSTVHLSRSNNSAFAQNSPQSFGVEKELQIIGI